MTGNPEIEELIRDLCHRLHRLNSAYYCGTAEVNDEVYDELKKELTLGIRQKIGPIATPDKIQFAPGLPKTRSGKIMRRILRKIAPHEEDQLGDTSTLADPTVVDDLICNRKNK